MAEALGLVGGAGALPALMAREARQAGWRVVAFALAESEPLETHADRVVPCRVGDVGPILAALGGEGIRHVVLAGRVRKDVLFHGAHLDATAERLVSQAANWTDEGLLGVAVQALAGDGHRGARPATLPGTLAGARGPAAGPPILPELQADVARGLTLARELAARGVGPDGRSPIGLGCGRGGDGGDGRGRAPRPGARGPGRGRGQGRRPPRTTTASTSHRRPRHARLLRRGRAAVLRWRRGACCCWSASASRGGRPAGMSVVGVAERPGVD